MRAILALAACAWALAGVMPARAQQPFPSKPIHIIVPYPPGGLLDAVIRMMAPQVGQSIGQPVVVENRPGGASFIGMSACANAPPDGYTLCLTTPDSLSYNPLLYNNVPYDAVSDFVGVTNIAFTGPALIYTGRPELYHSFRDVIAAAKAKPGGVFMGTWGTGSAADLYRLYINQQFGIDIAGVAYKGAGPALAATLAGEGDLSFWGIGALLPHLKSGKIRGLISALKRTDRADVPSFPDLGVPDPGIVQYLGLYAPAKTPAATVERLNAEFAKAVRSPVSLDYLKKLDFEPVGNSPAAFAAFMKADRENAARLLTALGVERRDLAE
jgi:tripartite-type tricarboxylate transporter receptor subunit TctC